MLMVLLFLLLFENIRISDHVAGDASNSSEQGESDEPKEQGKKVKILHIFIMLSTLLE